MTDESASPRRPSAEIDTSTPHQARVWNFLLGGKDYYQVDRETAEHLEQHVYPGIKDIALHARAFLGRAVRYVAEEAQIKQFLDIGTGLPTADNTHDVAQRVDPTSRIVYVDNDPLVLVHARALLTSAPEGATAYVDADLRNPEKILKSAELAATLDLTKPVSLNLVAVLHFVHDNVEAYALVETLKDALAPSSLLVLSHGSYDRMRKPYVRALTSGKYPGSGDFHARTKDEVSKFFTSFELVAPDPRNPGKDLVKPDLGMVSRWGRRREDGRAPAASRVSTWGAVARKPGAANAGGR